MLGINDWIAISIAFIANLVIAFGFFLRMNVKIAEINERYISLSKVVSDHKDDNKDAFSSIVESLRENRNENKDEHREITTKIDKFLTIMSDLNHTIIQNIK